MAVIADFLEKIKNAKFGIDVRDSIHDSIKAINDEVEANTLASNEAVQSASTSAVSAANAETAANKAKDDVAAVKTDIYNTAIPQIQQIKADTEQIRQDTSNLKDETSVLKSDTEGFKDNADQIKKDTLSIQKECERLAEKCENATSGIDGGIIPCGTKLFEELPLLTGVKKGWMFNISDEFTTTDDFLGGADYYYPAGTNVYAVLFNDELKWDCLGGEMSGYLMKRDFESTLAEAKIEFEEPAELKVASGITTIKNLFGNVAKIIKLLGKTDLSDEGDDVTSVLRTLLDKVGNTDISGIGDGTITNAISTLNSDITLDLSNNKNTAILEVNNKHCLLTFNGHLVDAKAGSFYSLFNLIPKEYLPQRRYAYSSIFALFNNKYYMVYAVLDNLGNWTGYGVSTSSDGYIYLTGQSSWNGTIEWLL